MAVPVSGNSIETEIYTFLTKSMGLNKAAACAVLANIQKESNFKLTQVGDNGTSYGLCQWHDTGKGVGRWTNLKNYCSNNGFNVNTVKGQMSYLRHELQTSYSAVWRILTSETPNTAQGVWDAAAQFCARFEVPAGYGSWNNGVLTLGPTSRARGDYAKNTFWSAYSGVNTTTTTPVNKGNLIVQEAKKHLGTVYYWGGSSPSPGFDCSGFVYYVYKQAINYNWSRTTAYEQWKKYGSRVGTSELMAGDLVFFKDTYNTGNSPNISHVGIATGNGQEFIQASGGHLSGNVNISTLDNSYWKSHFYAAKRLLSSSETSYGDGSGSGSSNPSYVNAGIEDISLSRTYIRTYTEEIAEALEYIESQNAASYRSSKTMYGYLIDLVNGGEFKFYAPEYDVSIRPQWDTQSIIGRSTSIKGYNNTESRSVPIALELMAGEGLYRKGRSPRNDVIADMLDDIAFVESLAYPDYSKSIVLPPPVVLLYLGPNMKMKGIISDVNTSYMKPYDTSLRPMRAKISFTITHVTETPPDYYDIRNNRFEGIRTGSVTYDK